MDLKITIAPEPSTASAQGRQDTWPYAYPCGCNLDVGYCTVHGQMMAVIHHVWNNRATSEATMRAIWAWADAYGEPGALPPQGYDWSGIRDSTPVAIERMWEVASGQRTS